MQIKKIQEKLPVIIAVACGILAIVLLSIYLKRREGEIWEKIRQVQRRQTQPTQPAPQLGVVLVAKNDIPPQIPITPDDVLIKEIPVEYIQPGAVTSFDEVIGQITSIPITAGEQILKTELLPPGKISKSLSEITPAGKRAVTVPVDNMASIANLIRPGDYVDVLTLITIPEATAQPSKKSSAPRLISLFQAVEVLAVGGEFVAPSEISRTAKKEQAKAISAGSGTVTLALSPQEAALLSFVQEHGKIKLTLRSSEDTQKEAIKPADWDTLFQYLYPPTELGPEGRQPVVEVYHGLRKEIMPLSEKEK